MIGYSFAGLGFGRHWEARGPVQRAVSRLRISRRSIEPISILGFSHLRIRTAEISSHNRRPFAKALSTGAGVRLWYRHTIDSTGPALRPSLGFDGSQTAIAEAQRQNLSNV